MQPLTISQAIEGYLLAARARRLAPGTIRSYEYGWDQFRRFLASDPPLASITLTQLRAFLAGLDHLSAKTVRICYHSLAALWTWAVSEGIVTDHLPHHVGSPRVAEREIIPYSKDEILAMLRAIERTRGYRRGNQRLTDNARPSAPRDRAILLLLLDTGIRASELCGLQLNQADLRNHRVIVQGKGARERMVPISPRTEQAIWRYVKTRPEVVPGNALFVAGPADIPRPLTTDVLRRLLHRIGERGGVRGVNVHRFRHTFAIQALRNGMHVYALQACLGHSTLEMVRRYLAIAQTDVEAAHREASPVSNWLL